MCDELCVGGVPLPKTKLIQVEQGETQFGPAPLDPVSLWNGVFKFECHDQKGVDSEFIPYALDYLNLMFPFARYFSGVTSHEDVIEKILSPEHKSRASGYPWRHLGAGSKQQTVEKFPEFYKESESVINSTLKDELRLKGKDSRFFRPQSVHDYYEGIRLFDNTNDHLASLLFRTPIFIKFRTPGRDLALLFSDLVAFGGNIYGSDGSRWDANFPLLGAEIIATWRASLDPEHRREIKLYYRKMYNGVTLVGGHAFHLVGNPSGHVNTSVDNSLMNMIAMAYTCYKCGFAVEDIKDKVLYFCCGDDLIWCDRSNMLTPDFVGQSYLDLGIFLEFQSFTPLARDELTFVGCTSSYDPLYGWQYHGKLDKMCDSSKFSKRSYSPIDRLAKLVSLQVLVRFSDRWKYLNELTHRYIMYCVVNNLISINHPDVAGLLRMLDSDVVAGLYLELEQKGLIKVPAFLKRCLIVQCLKQSSSDRE